MHSRIYCSTKSGHPFSGLDESLWWTIFTKTEQQNMNLNVIGHLQIRFSIPD
jgi:hypothetical protein